MLSSAPPALGDVWEVIMDPSRLGARRTFALNTVGIEHEVGDREQAPRADTSPIMRRWQASGYAWNGGSFQMRWRRHGDRQDSVFVHVSGDRLSTGEHNVRAVVHEEQRRQQER